MNKLNKLFKKYKGDWDEVKINWDSFIKAMGGPPYLLRGCSYKRLRKGASFYIPPAFWFCECMLRNIKDLNDWGMWSAIEANQKDFKWSDVYVITRRHAFRRNNVKIYSTDWFYSRETITAKNTRTGETFEIQRAALHFLWFIYDKKF